MTSTSQEFTRSGFAKSFLLPALSIFLVPVVGLLFFLHAQNHFNSELAANVKQQIAADKTMTPEERAKALAFFDEHPFSELVLDGKFAAQVDRTMLFYYTTFRWMIRLAGGSILLGITILLLAGVCVFVSRRSQQALYWSLAVGWQLLRLCGAIQVVVQGILLVALSFWVTALLMNVYIVKLILVVGLLAFAAVAAILKAIFTTPKNESMLTGSVLRREEAPRLWRALDEVSRKVGTNSPDHVVLGIDDNFFVTELPICVAGTTYKGRTLYISLALLKQMHGSEAESVLAHEMAHFSGQDTVYTKKISPLLDRYQAYLQSLYDNLFARPVFYFMLCFRAMFELSLSDHSRKREFRADRIAAETTSPRDIAGALLRIAAYTKFRNSVQMETFEHNGELESANISSKIDAGFHSYALTFANAAEIGDFATTHPFDSHPTLSQRFEAVGVSITPEMLQSLVSMPGNGSWYRQIENAEEMERQQWEDFEQQFCAAHEESLPYRFLPETEEEREIVKRTFPDVTFPGKKGDLLLDCETFRYTEWEGSLAYSELIQCALQEDGSLKVQYQRDGEQVTVIPMKTLGSQHQRALDTFSRYYSRYLTAAAYQAEKTQEKQDDA